MNVELVHKATATEHTKSLWTRFYKVAVKFFETVRFASDTRKTIEPSARSFDYWAADLEKFRQWISVGRVTVNVDALLLRAFP